MEGKAFALEQHLFGTAYPIARESQHFSEFEKPIQEWTGFKCTNANDLCVNKIFLHINVEYVEFCQNSNVAYMWSSLKK